MCVCVCRCVFVCVRVCVRAHAFWYSEMIEKSASSGMPNHNKKGIKVHYVDVIRTFDLKISILCGCPLSRLKASHIFSLKPHVCFFILTFSKRCKHKLKGGGN